jgi:hypothetical protein
MLMTRKRNLCCVALLLALLLPLTAQAQRGRATQIVKIRVRVDETVAMLAERYGVTAQEIARLNNIERDAQLQPGMEIRMPSASTAQTLVRRTSLAPGIGGDVRARAALYEPYIRAAARRYGVDPRVLWTIAYLETRFQPRRVSPKGAQGMMQFMPGTAATYGLANPFDAVAAIDAAARYVRDLSRRFNRRFDLVLASYNAGEGAVDAYLRGVSLRLPDGRVINPRGIRNGGVPPYAETRNYVSLGASVARGITSAGVFSQGDVLASGAPLTLPSGAGTGDETTGAAVPSSAEIAQSVPEIITPTSSYASGDWATTSTNETSAGAPSGANRTTAPAMPVARSFRASAKVPGDSLRRGAAGQNAPRAQTDAPATVTTVQPRSTRVAVVAP